MKCTEECDCSRHGKCGWLDGVCACYQDADLGFFAGETCDVCSEGYMEPDCRTSNVAISRGLEAPPISAEEGADADSVVISDEAAQLIYTGGMPLNIFHSGDSSLLTKFSLGGMIRSGSLGPDSVFLLVEDAVTAEMRMVSVSRGYEPLVSNTTGAGHHLQRLRRRMRTLAAAPAAEDLSIIVTVGVYSYWVTFSAGTSPAPSASIPCPQAGRDRQGGWGDFPCRERRGLNF